LAIVYVLVCIYVFVWRDVTSVCVCTHVLKVCVNATGGYMLNVHNFAMPRYLLNT